MLANFLPAVAAAGDAAGAGDDAEAAVAELDAKVDNWLSPPLFLIFFFRRGLMQYER